MKIRITFDIYKEKNSTLPWIANYHNMTGSGATKGIAIFHLLELIKQQCKTIESDKNIELIDLLKD